MQVEIVLRAETPVFLPFSYYDKMAAAVYSTMQEADTTFAQNVHSGSEHANRIKLFGFSPLTSPYMKIEKGNGNDSGGLRIRDYATFRIASPWPELANTFGTGLHKLGRFRIGSQYFWLERARILAPPTFRTSMTWQPRKPASIVTSWSDDERKAFLLPGNPHKDKDVTAVLRKNLVHKWQRLSELRPDIARRWANGGEDFAGGLANAYCEDQIKVRVAHSQHKTKLHYIKGSPVRSWIASVVIEAPVPLQKIVYTCGLGQMNSMGFGVAQEAVHAS